MDRTGQGGPDPQCIPIDLTEHVSKLQISNSVAKFNSGLVPLYSSMTKKGWTYLTFFAVLIGLFYFMLIQLIPGFSQPKVNPVSFVRPFQFTNQDGQRVTEKDFAGQVYVAEFFFTTCKGICPRMNNNMRTVYDAFKDEPNFRILSHTCDPDTDSVPQMKKYSDSMQVDTKRWIFVTGRKDSLYTAARVSYTIDDPANNPANIEDDFLHTQFWALVDQNGDVRKVVDGLKPSEINDLIESTRELLKNPPLKK
jgi:protein SCO1/2